MAKGFKVIEGGRGAGCGFLSDAEIDAFLAGNLDAERGRAFGDHRSAGCGPCSLFGADLEMFRQLVESGVTDAERRDFEALADGQREEIRRAVARAEVPRGKAFPRWVLSAAAVIALAGFLSIQLLDPKGGGPAVTLPDGNAFHFSVPAAPPLVRDGGDFARGRAAFAAGEYAAAAAAFERVPDTHPMYADAAFYAGVSHLLNHADPPAVERLTLARELAIADGLSGDGAAYYLALAQIETGNHDAARKLLTSIRGGRNEVDAARLLELLGTEGAN